MASFSQGCTLHNSDTRLIAVDLFTHLSHMHFFFLSTSSENESVVLTLKTNVNFKQNGEQHLY